LDQKSAIDVLVDHHSSQRYHPEHHYRNVVNVEGEHLDAYIPYIGKSYFNTKPRLLIYAMSQNLSHARQLISQWLNSPDRGLHRQYDEPGRVHVFPYDNGHLKVIAALALSSYPGTRFETCQSLDNLVAVTNFVKFSFYRVDKNGNRLDANPPSAIYDDMWEYYCRYEIDILTPDIIIVVGKEVADAIIRNMQRDHKQNIIVVKVPFPGRLNLNSRWVPKGRELIKTTSYDPTTDISEMQALVRGTPDFKGRMMRAIKTDWYYFTRMETYIREQISRQF
jgi:hypothetical protein